MTDFVGSVRVLNLNPGVARFTIFGPPRTKKNSSNIAKNRSTGQMFLAPDKAKAAWEKMAVDTLRTQLRPTTTVVRKIKGRLVEVPVQFTGPVHVTALFYREKNLGDTCGFYQALGDALEKSGVLANDRQIEYFDGSRRLIDRKNPRVEVTVEAL